MRSIHASVPAPRTHGELPPTAPLPSILQTLACRLRPLEYLEWCRVKIGASFTVNAIDMPPLVFVSDPSDVRTVVTAPLSVLPPGAGAVTAPLLGETSFILANEDEHLDGRSAITPAFHREAIERHAGMVADLARREIATWPLETAMPIYPRLCAITMGVILKTIFGDDDKIDVLQAQMLSMLSVASSLVLQAPRLRRLPGWRSTWQHFIRDRKKTDELIATLIATRRTAQGRPRGDMLAMLLDARRANGTPMTDRELRDNLVSVIIAGHETTASALAWAFQLIAHHPHVQQRLVYEIDTESGTQYMTATVNETLRHRPVFLFTAPRAVAQSIEVGNWSFQPPTQLLACIYLMHHDASLFPDPHTFRPERFLESQTPIHRWLPWGGGRQRCPGRHLALVELQTVLDTTLSTLRILPASRTIERPSWRSAIVTPHAGSMVLLRNRSRPSHVGSKPSP